MKIQAKVVAIDHLKISSSAENFDSSKIIQRCQIGNRSIFLQINFIDWNIKTCFFDFRFQFSSLSSVGSLKR